MSRAMQRAKSSFVFVLQNGGSVGLRDGLERVVIGSMNGLLLGYLVIGDFEGIPLSSIVSGDRVGSAGNDAFSSITLSAPVTSVFSATVGMFVGLGLGLLFGERLGATDGDEVGTLDGQGCDLRPKYIFDSDVGDRDGSNVDTTSSTAASPSYSSLLRASRIKSVESVSILPKS